MAGFEDDATTFTRRGLVLGVSQIALFSLLAGRLQYLQVARSDLYATLAEDNRVNVRLMAPPRGQIFDRNKVKLADNDQDFQVVLIPEQAGDLDATVAKLSQLLGFSDRQQKDLLRRARRGPKFRPLTVAENLSWETFSQVNLNLPFLSGVQPRVGDRRIYSFADATAHSVGSVGIETKRDIEVHGNAPSDMVGRSGIERYFEAALRGEAGVRHVEVNAHGRTVRELAFDPGRPGADIELTLDISLQKFAHERMAGHSGSAIVMDTQTGDLLCIVSTPAFDPNKLSQGVDTKSWNEMVAHERKPLMN
ncbi:MAG: penicillin-binding protein 2, partial [Pseudomonadota bacterium]|nr:penicillin-binding protein 2 [Pseudomonadota bacterium]